MTTTDLRLLYFFDPLCGWCYASAPALAGLAETFPNALEMMPSGLFAGAGARPMSAQFADYAWTNDQRIAQMTGQVFSETYREKVLRAADGIFDSGPATRAMTALAAIDTALEPALLHELQLARYVDGQDTTRPEVITAIAARVADELGVDLDGPAFIALITEDADLAEATGQRIAETQAAMQRLPSQGVPQLLVLQGERAGLLNGEALLGGPASLIAAIERFRAGA